MFMLDWLTQDLVIPLWAYLASLLLPAAFFARIAKAAVKQKVSVLGGSSKE